MTTTAQLFQTSEKLAADLSKRWKPYPNYKPSDVEWLGDVPEHWTVDRQKWSVRGCQNGFWGEEPDGKNDIACIRVADFDRTRFRVVNDPPTVRAVDRNERKGRILCRGDLIIEKSGGGDKQLVGCVVSFDHDFPALTSNFVARMPIAKGMVSRFWVYVHAAMYSGRLNYPSIKQTTGIQNLDSAAYLNERVVYPPLSEQHAIADFLDQETAQIDALMAEKEKLITLLEEKRSVLIGRAVTRGLAPAVPLKDSGIPWLGLIPKHWRVMRIAMLCDKLTNGFVGPTRDILTSDGVRYLQSLHIKDGLIRFDKPYYVSPEWSSTHSKSVLKADDVLVVQTGDLGQCAVVTPEFEGCNCHALIILRIKKGMGSGKYLSALFRSSYGQQSLLTTKTGATLPHLECGKLHDIFIPLPSADEQVSIMRKLDETVESMKFLRADLDQSLALLHEHRASLITVAVTGKIDVRGSSN